ncbi:MAG: transporter, partial [Planctomycetota bacterium]
MLIASPGFSFADERPTWQYGLSFSYLTGDYGEEEDTDILYTAATIKRYFEEGDVMLTIPYLDISDGGVTFIDGGAEAVAGAEGGSGLGDIILKGRYYAVEQDDMLPFIDLVGSLKIPTADEDKGLGTGEADFTVMAEFARRLADEAWVALGELGYTFVGEPSGSDADNR